MNKATAFVAFVIGAAAGSAVTWYGLKTKYQQYAEEEVNELREYYSSKLANAEDEHLEVANDIDEEPSPTEIKSNRIEMTKIAERQNYSGYFKTEAEGISEDPNILEPRPVVVSPEELEDEPDYEWRDITVYADDVVCDDNDDKLDDVENIIGADSLNHFGEYTEHVIYVRNDRLKCYFEISKDARTYEEVLESAPYKRKG